MPTKGEVAAIVVVASAHVGEEADGAGNAADLSTSAPSMGPQVSELCVLCLEEFRAQKPENELRHFL